MENRWNMRRFIRLNVMIYYGPLGLISGLSRDISATGMFVETGRIALANDETIDLNFRFKDGFEEKNYSISASVVHSSHKGSGLKFLNYTFMPMEQKTSTNQTETNVFADA